MSYKKNQDENNKDKKIIEEIEKIIDSDGDSVVDEDNSDIEDGIIDKISNDDYSDDASIEPEDDYDMGNSRSVIDSSGLEVSTIVTKKKKKADKKSTNGFINSSEQYLMSNNNKYKLLSKEDEIELANQMSEMYFGIIGQLIPFWNLNKIIEQIKEDILNNRYTIKTLIDISVFNDESLKNKKNEKLLTEEVLSRCDSFLTEHKKFMESTEILRKSKKKEKYSKVFSMSQRSLELFKNINIQKKYINQLIKTFKKTYNRCIQIEEDFTISRVNKKKKNPVLLEEYNSILSGLSCSFNFLKDTIEQMLLYYKKNNAIERKITNANLRLVYSIARSVSKKSPNLFVDCLQSGFTGLKHAIQKYNTTFKCRMATYFYLWINQKQKRTQHQSNRIMSLPVHMCELACKIYRAETVLENQLGYQPPIEQVAEYCGLSIEKIQKTKLRTKKTIRSNKTISDGNTTLEDTITNNISPQEQIIEDTVRSYKEISSISQNLTPRNEYLLRKKITLDSMGSHNTDKVVSIKKKLSENLYIGDDRLRQTVSRSANQFKSFHKNSRYMGSSNSSVSKIIISKKKNSNKLSMSHKLFSRPSASKIVKKQQGTGLKNGFNNSTETTVIS